ncbi:MAG: helix-hairpin-helix domain-containing protein [Desulfobacteraceae bacterium]|nr:helix-hairpin-helix domain-containing protein [Desulfobacteraceae bacterium]
MKRVKKISIIILAGILLVAMSQPILASKGKVNINTATKKELVVLKHVGDKTADKIIEYRKAHPFQKAEDIMNVKGIGQKVFDANKDLIVVKD